MRLPLLLPAFILGVGLLPTTSWGQVETSPAPSTPNQTAPGEGKPPTVSVKEGRQHLLPHKAAGTPPIALSAHVSGVVVLGVEIDTAGNVTQVVTLSGPPLLTGSAIDAVRQYKYGPFLIGGVPAVVRTAVQVTFAPGRSTGD